MNVAVALDARGCPGEIDSVLVSKTLADNDKYFNVLLSYLKESGVGMTLEFFKLTNTKLALCCSNANRVHVSRLARSHVLMR